MLPPALLLSVVLSAPGAAAAVCACQGGGPAGGANRSVSVQSGPPGICSAASDAAFCATTQLQVGGADTVRAFLRRPGRAAIRDAVAAAGVALDPVEALRLAGTAAPESWPADQVPDILTAVMALVLAGKPDRLRDVHATLVAHAAAVRGPLTRGTGDARPLSLGAYQASVGYGCLAIRDGAFQAVARTPFALGSACR